MSWWFNAQWSLRASWVLDATSSWMDSLLVSHQPPSLPLLLSSSLPPSLPPSLLFSRCWRAQTEQHQHCCPHHLLCPAALCSMFTHRRGFFERADWAHNKHTHTAPVLHLHRVPLVASSWFVLPSFTLSSSCQVDISFISQEVFDRSF